MKNETMCMHHILVRNGINYIYVRNLQLKLNMGESIQHPNNLLTRAFQQKWISEILIKNKDFLNTANE